MKRVFLILAIYCTSIVSAQGQAGVDSISIAFKAKLFTISEYGIADREKILLDVERQNYRFLKSVYKNFLFIKIEFNQPYTISDGSERTLLRDCNYYIAYSIPDCRFYRLGGFDFVEIDAFFKDLTLREGWIFKNPNGEQIEEIDLHCLYSYYKLSTKKRIREGYHCFVRCSEVTSTVIMDQ